MEVSTPQGELNILNVPEKYLLMNKSHTLEINIKNTTLNSDKPTDFYLKYRANGCKLLNIPSNLDNKVRFSMSPNQNFSFQIQIMPTIEGPLQLEIQFVGIQKKFKERPIEIEVEVEQEIEQEIEEEVPTSLHESMVQIPKTCINCRNFQKTSKFCTQISDFTTPEDTCDSFTMLPFEQIPPQTKKITRVEKKNRKETSKTNTNRI